MAMRVKNVAAGFYDSSGFHPDRAGGLYSQRRPAAKRKKKATGRKSKPKAHARRALPTNIQPDTMRKHNPIPVKWATAKVRKVGNDIQVMLFPEGTAKRRTTKRRTTKRRTIRNVTRRRRR